MNWEHLKAFVWLRWRLMSNQYRRAGTFNAVLMSILSIAAVVIALPLLIGSVALGVYLIPKATPIQLLYAWDAILLGFLFFWGLGLLTELQRHDPLALSKFLHLPVTVHEAFLINYLSSLIRLSLIVFVPVMLGFALALAYVKGGLLLLTPALLAAFLLMVTALTYQFQGWLASLMSNPRRRRTVVMIATGFFVLLFQLPNLINLYGPWGPWTSLQTSAQRSVELSKEMDRLTRAHMAKEFDATELLRRQREVINRYQQAKDTADRKQMDDLARVARIANTALPVGWLPLGVLASAEGRGLPAALALLGMTLIGTVSLRRAYRTTLGIFQGESTNRSAPAISKDAPAAPARKPGQSLLEVRIPGLSEPVTAIALGGLRSLLRSPEAKMSLMTPVIMCVIFGSMIFKTRQTMPESFRALIPIGGMVFILLGVLQLACNQFGFDRDGFRVYVLSAAPRRDILLGKNLAFVPLALSMATVLLVAVQVLCPLRLDHFLALFPQFVSMFLLACLFTNLVSICTPMYLAAGTLKPSNPRLVPIFFQMLMLVFIFPITQIPAFLPLGLEAYMEFMEWSKGVPICLLASLVECALAVGVYLAVLQWQGRLLQSREQTILETVTNRST